MFGRREWRWGGDGDGGEEKVGDVPSRWDGGRKKEENGKRERNASA